MKIRSLVLALATVAGVIATAAPAGAVSFPPRPRPPVIRHDPTVCSFYPNGDPAVPGCITRPPVVTPPPGPHIPPQL